MTYSTALGTFAPNHTISHHGRTYRVQPLTQAAKATFERRLIEQAMAAAALVPEPYRLATLAAISRDAATGTFAFYGRTGQETLNSESGLIMLASVLLDCSPDDAVTLAAERGAELFALLDLVILEGLPEKQREQVLAERERSRTQSANGNQAGPSVVPTQPAAA